MEYFIRYRDLGGKIVSCRAAVANEIVTPDRVHPSHFKNVWPAPFARGFVPRSAADESASTYPASEVLLPAKMEIRALRSS